MLSKKKDVCGGICYLIAAIFLLIIVLIILFNTDFVKWADDHSGFASWVQAIFGGGAVIVAIAIPNMQRARDRRDRLEQEVSVAINEFVSIISIFINITKRFDEYHEVIRKIGFDKTGDTNWISLYLKIFEIYKLPQLPAINSTAVLDEDYSYRLGIIYSIFSAVEARLLMSDSINKLHADSQLLTQSNRIVEVINTNLGGWKVHLNELNRDFSKKYSQDALHLMLL